MFPACFRVSDEALAQKLQSLEETRVTAPQPASTNLPRKQPKKSASRMMSAKQSSAPVNLLDIMEEEMARQEMRESMVNSCHFLTNCIPHPVQFYSLLCLVLPRVMISIIDILCKVAFFFLIMKVKICIIYMHVQTHFIHKDGISNCMSIKTICATHLH